jgi:hypothetical protein
VNTRVAILAGWEQIDLGQQSREATRLSATDSAPLERNSPGDSECGRVSADIDRDAGEQITRVGSRHAVREIVTDRTRGSREGSPRQ